MQINRERCGWLQVSAHWAFEAWAVGVLILLSFFSPAESPGAVPTCRPVSREEQTALHGQILTDDLKRQLLRNSGAVRIRVLSPNAAATMEARQDRINVQVDDQNKILSIWCDAYRQAPP